MVSGGSGRGLDHSNHVQHRLQDGGAPNRSENDDDDDDDDGGDGCSEDHKSDFVKFISLTMLA